jgi:hypothetical protein
LAGYILLATLFTFASAGCKKQATNVTAQDIEVIRVERRQATIAWTTTDAFQGEVFYRTAAGGNAAVPVKETLSKSFHHQVALTNLTPGTRYTYWIDNPGKRYQFQTRPEANTPFSFILVGRAGASGPSLIFGAWTGGNCTCGLPIPLILFTRLYRNLTKQVSRGCFWPGGWPVLTGIPVLCPHPLYTMHLSATTGGIRVGPWCLCW